VLFVIFAIIWHSWTGNTVCKNKYSSINLRCIIIIPKDPSSADFSVFWLTEGGF